MRKAEYGMWIQYIGKSNRENLRGEMGKKECKIPYYSYYMIYNNIVWFLLSDVHGSIQKSE